MATVLTVNTKSGIQWYCESQGQGPSLILVPSGEGDCSSFDKVAAQLADSFKVTTFDMPGMSRSTAPETAMNDLSANIIAGQVIELMDQLSIEIATFYGCSSGGLIVLALAANYPARVRSVIVHEVPLTKKLPPLEELSDEQIVEFCHHVFSTEMVEDKGAWAALGSEYHSRLDRNYITWARKYVNRVERDFSKGELTVRPVDWTVGALAPMGSFFENVVTACHAGIPVSLLPCRHFPQVTMPEALAKHIREKALSRM
ncbi:hypothetical protein H2198_007923 [Neophaeococcomyces mojaviensis]|uniref:Uncharacterized protein n=1 Tax=Neophaeococcomyces mojaviensis TaxID=3383035 RepID=A0ACC2ZZB5_9EURO|nr:hypothetical protein H2198_007923 [Knufia sp. JES_112]